MSFWRNQPEPEAQHDQADAPFPVPPELQEFYDRAPGPDPQQVLLARAGVEGARPKEIELRPPGTGPGPRDEYRRLVDVDVDEWVHVTRLEQAEQARRADQFRRAIEDQYLVCDLCGKRVIGGQLAAIEHHGRQLRLCTADCHDVVAAEVNRRRWTDRIDQLLDTDPASTDAPVLG